MTDLDREQLKRECADGRGVPAALRASPAKENTMRWFLPLCVLVTLVTAAPAWALSFTFSGELTTRQFLTGAPFPDHVRYEQTALRDGAPCVIGSCWDWTVTLTPGRWQFTPPDTRGVIHGWGSGHWASVGLSDAHGRILAGYTVAQVADFIGLEHLVCNTPGQCVSLLRFDHHEIPLPSLGFPREYVRDPSETAFWFDLGVATSVTASLGLDVMDDATRYFGPWVCRTAPEACTATVAASFGLSLLGPVGGGAAPLPLHPTPEPATLLLVGTTAAGLALARWRQRRKTPLRGVAPE